MSDSTSVVMFLADPARELNEFTVTPGVLGFTIFAALGAAVWILLRSMSGRLNRLDARRDERGD
ncbi:hypothetical protein GCM10027160_51390 [Streptomyces calidiresistens]|uniref:Uncharacterized protein n=1 Tax=Streptomyces calidiresistens TaxID=1485586 RepID=A0A7W3T6M9_9ACTN|nr:hypothetical protein [Streptomyces calidiresistens]MBB0231626.1 hypothetical protein [Streptomyces calidiresistens]